MDLGLFLRALRGSPTADMHLLEWGPISAPLWGSWPHLLTCLWSVTKAQNMSGPSTAAAAAVTPLSRCQPLTSQPPATFSIPSHSCPALTPPSQGRGHAPPSQNYVATPLPRRIPWPCPSLAESWPCFRAWSTAVSHQCLWSMCWRMRVCGATVPYLSTSGMFMSSMK